MKKVLLTVLLAITMVIPVNIKAEESFKNFDYEFEPGKVRIVLNKEYDDNYTSTSAQMHNMVDYDLEGTAVTKFYEHAMVYVETLEGGREAYEVDLSKAVHGDIIEVTNDILIYVYSTGLMIFNVKENSGERVILDFDYEVEGDVSCGDYYVQFSGEHVEDNIPGALENERFEVTIAEEDSCVVVPEPDIPEYPFDPEDWGVEGGYPTDTDTGDEWEKEAGKHEWEKDREEEDKEILDKEDEWENAWNDLGNKVPMKPLEPATPIEKPEEPKEETPLTPLVPAEPIETPKDEPEDNSVEVPVEEPKEVPVEEKEEDKTPPEVITGDSQDKKEDKVETPKEEVSEVLEASSAAKEPVDVLPPTGVGNGFVLFAAFIALVGGVILYFRD